MFLEVTSVMLLLVPILVPMLKPLGIDPVHFCVVLVVNMEIAMITPPVGLNLFVISSVSKVSLKEVVKGIWPMVLLFIGFLLLITWFPAISLWLPNLLLGS
jgi:C4-dicarboxylate transporter DctM subunit